MLLEQHGGIVSREDIRQRLWPADTFVEFDHSVNTAIKKLRQTRNDDADNPRFIETIPQEGLPIHRGSIPTPFVLSTGRICTKWSVSFAM